MVVLHDAAQFSLGDRPGLSGRLQDGRALFAVDGEGRSDLVSVREIAAVLAQDEGGLLAYAAALLNWPLD